MRYGMFISHFAGLPLAPRAALGREIFTLYSFLIYSFNSIIPNLSLQKPKIFTRYFRSALRISSEIIRDSPHAPLLDATESATAYSVATAGYSSYYTGAVGEIGEIVSSHRGYLHFKGHHDNSLHDLLQ